MDTRIMVQRRCRPWPRFARGDAGGSMRSFSRD